MAQARKLQPHPDNPGCPAPFHGDENAYQNAEPCCRCPDALADHVRKRTARELGLIGPLPAHGAQRRARALVAIGHSIPAISAAAGLHKSNVHRLIYGRLDRDIVARSTDAGLRRAFEELADKPATSQWASAMRRKAANLGWPRPDEWWPGELDDPDADPRADLEAEPDGDPVALVSAIKFRSLDWHGLTPADQEQVFVRLRAEDQSYAAIAELAGVHRDEVERIAERIANRRRRREASARRAQAQAAA